MSVRERVITKKMPIELYRPGMVGRLSRALDNAIFELSPRWGMNRLSSRYKRSLVDHQMRLVEQLGYSWPGAKPSDIRDGRYLGSRMSPDEAIEHDLPELRRRCVELYRGNTIAHAAVEGRVSHEVGIGLTRQPRVHEDENITKEQANRINNKLKEVADQWSKHGVDKRRRKSLAAVQRLACRTFANYGECFIRVSQSPYSGPIGLTIDVISPERIETPPELMADDTVRMGIKTVHGNILGYYIRKSHPDAGRGYRYGYDFVHRFDVNGQPKMLHVMDEVFPDQSRGIPWLATAINRIKDLDDYFEYEIILKQVETCLGVFVTGGQNSGSPHEIAEGNAERVASDGMRLEKLEGGLVHYMNEGEDVKIMDPNRPGSSFSPFIELSLRSIAAALNYPYEVLAKNFFRTTFSSGRLAMLDGWMGFSMRQQPLVEQMLDPVWRAIVHDAVFSGEMDGLINPIDYLERPCAYERNRWAPQARGFVDPPKEVGAHVDALEAGIATKASIFGEKGEDWEDAEEQLDAEERKRIELRTLREIWEDEFRASHGLEPVDRTGGDEEDEDEESEVEQGDLVNS